MGTCPGVGVGGGGVGDGVVGAGVEAGGCGVGACGESLLGIEFPLLGTRPACMMPRVELVTQSAKCLFDGKTCFP